MGLSSDYIVITGSPPCVPSARPVKAWSLSELLLNREANAAVLNDVDRVGG